MINVFIFFSIVSIFLNLFKYYSFYTGVAIYVFYIVIAFTMIAYYSVANKNIEFSKNLFIWILFYFILNTIYYINTGMGGIIEYKRYVSVIAIWIIFIGYSLLAALDTKELKTIRKSILIAMLISVILLIIDFVFPGFFLLKQDLFLGGRALGTYNNQNIAGAVLILGMILSIDFVPVKYRIFYIIYIFIGITVTFSRSNLIIFFVIVLIMAIQKKISRLSVAYIYSFLFLILFWLATGGLEYIGEQFDIVISKDLLNRVTFFADNKDADLSDTHERKMVLYAALDMFMNHPIFGNGFASTSAGIWEYRVGPHNNFARTWAEFGIFGVLVIPLLLISSTYQAFFTRKEYRDVAVLFIIYFTMSSFFSHNILDQEFNFVGALIIATLGYKNISPKE